MKTLPSIPLSYNQIVVELLARKLKEYDHRHHDDIIEDFEARLKHTFAVKHAIALNSGTAALHLALKALDVGKDDVVISSTFTYVASVNPILYLGAMPYFVDSCRDDWNMDPNLLEDAIQKCLFQGKKPKAILVVHTYGMPAKLDQILGIANKHDIPVLEDAAESVGSTFQGQYTGTIGAIGIFSFNNNKIISTYGGGVLMTSDPVIAAKVNSWANQSRDNLPFYEHREVGFNYRMSPLNAACGLYQLDEIPLKVNERINYFEHYKNSFAGILDGYFFQKENPQSRSNRWLTGLVLPKSPDVVRGYLADNGVETRFLWKPMHLQPLFSNCPACLNGVSEFLFKNGLCIPSGGMSGEDQSFVVESIKDAILGID